MAAEDQGLKEIPEFLREFLNPSTLGSFRDSMPSGELTVMLHTAPDAAPTSITLKNMFPFMTLQDIKIALYIELKKDDAAIPEFVYLTLHGSSPGKTYMGGVTTPVDYTWYTPGQPKANNFLNNLPFQAAVGKKAPDSRFVDSNGERKLISLVNRERITIEDAFFKLKLARGIPEFHAYLYKDVLEAIPGAKPPSEKIWNGVLYPFYPYLPVRTMEATADQRNKAQRLAKVFSRRQQFLMRLQALLDEDVPLVQLRLGRIKFLRLVWAKKKGIPGIESLFYEAPVTERRPFMRLIPLEGSGISKVFFTDEKVPDIQDPKLLVSWSQERNPTPEQDYAFAKILLRRALSNQTPIYGTLRLFNDGSSDFIVEPPRGVKNLEPRTDLQGLGDNLVEGLKELPYIDSRPDIGNAAMVLGLKLKKEQPAITIRSLRERLPVFTSFFQEIAALPGEKPLIMLRFKMVSNFATEDRIQTFITQVMNRKALKGEGITADLVELVADEFQLDVSDARKQVAIKLQAQGEIAIVNPETKDYMLQNNPGIDVAIIGQHPFYTFHLYRVDSLENLQRVVTALSLMISADVEDLQVGKKAAQELVTLEAPVEEVEVEAANIATEVGSEDIADYGDLDLFAMDDVQGEMTLEEAHAAERLAAEQGTPYVEPLGERPASPIIAPVAAPVETLRREIAGAPSPKEDLEGSDVEEPAGKISIANFFINKLKEADRRLFDYTKKSNSSVKRYVSKCQPTHGRQPAVLSESQFQRMVEEYAGDSVYFQIFPLQPDDPVKPPGVAERDYYTVLRYGTTPQNQNYYICCRFFCTKDEIMIREVDLKSSVMRQPAGQPKKPGECPFCKGTVIENRKTPMAGQTILERMVKPKSDGRHLFINFLKGTPHPEGFYLPCCFIEESPIKFSNPAFDKYKEWTKKTVITEAPELDRAESDSDSDSEGPREDAGLPILDYYSMLQGVTKKYIIGAEKMPLEVSSFVAKGQAEAQVGLLPPVLDAYFDQDPTELVSRTFNPQKIKEGGTGFLRIGVENRSRYKNDSFLAAIAPYYNWNTAEQMKKFLLDKITPRIFLSLNYGNLAIEFYDPADSVVKRPTEEELASWASEELDLDLHEENQESLMRAYMSHTSFQAWLKSDKTKKEFRHFSLALSQSNLIRRTAIGPGTTFIVLDILKSGELSVRCPPFGYNADVMSGNDIAFLLHHWSGIWEPIFYVDNRPVEQRGIDIVDLKFKMSNSDRWPPIVGQRLQEYMSQCASSGRAAFTSQSKINSMAMLPASIVDKVMRREKNLLLDAVVRDSYNHLVALLFKEKDTPGPGYIAVPVVDDGQLFIRQKLFMDWDDPEYKRAPIDQVVKFYKKYVEARFSFYPGFSPIRVVKGKRSGTIEAIQLRNGLYVPAGPGETDLPSVTVDQMEWSLNHEICLEEKGVEVPGEKARMKAVEFQEVFEHLRLTFSNWLASKEDGGEFRDVLEDVIFSRTLPLYEKRKRLEILLAHEIEDWITTDFNSEDKKRAHETSLLRVDCRVRGQGTCGGRCVWKKKGEEEKCLLHVPKETELGESDKKVSAPRVLLLRLIEELLRYGERRRQLLEQDVSRLGILEKPVIDGNQHIYPEKSAEWYELLRLEWADIRDEEPIFYEEMSRDAEPAAPLAEQEEATTLPPSLQLILNGGPDQDPKTGALRLFRAPFESLLVPIGMTPVQLAIKDDTTALTDEMIMNIIKTRNMPFIQINVSVDPPVVIAKQPVRPTSVGVPVIVITNDGPALLMRSPADPQLLKKEDMPKGLLNILLGAKKNITSKRQD
jgi:hypothetical protein